MSEKPSSRDNLWLFLGGGALCVVLVYVGLRWSHLLVVPIPSAGSVLPLAGEVSKTASFKVHPLIELLKLVMAALIGMVVTAVHTRCHRAQPLPRSMAQAQIMLAVAGALMMIIIGESLARAFGIAGAAAIIRFRTPVKDPKDAVILFLLMGLGMSAGLGAFGVAGMGTVFMCALLLTLDRIARERMKPRSMVLQLVAEGAEFPATHVHDVFATHGVGYEEREVVQGNTATVKYHISLGPEVSLDALNAELMDGASPGIKSVSWAREKKTE